MNKSLIALFERAQSWPDEAQEELTRLAEEIEAELTLGAYTPTEEELAGIQRGLADVAAGRLATDEQVEAVFAKYRQP